MTGLIGSIQQLETANATPAPAIHSKSLSGFGVSDRDQTYNFGNLSLYIGGIVFKDDGTVFATTSMGGTLDDFAIEYQASTAFTINSGVSVSSSTSDNLDVNPPQGLVGGLSVAGGGTRVYTFGRSTNNVNCFHLSTAWDFGSGGSAQSNFNTSSQISNVYDGFVKDDGTEMYVVGYGPDKVYQYSMSTAHNLSTASLTNSFDFSAKVAVCGGIHFESNGNAFVITDATTDKLYKYNLSTAWDITTSTFHSQSDSLQTDASTLSGVWFDDDWNYIFYTDQDGDDLYRIPTTTLAAAPSNLSASTASTSQINLSWSAVSGTGSVTYTIQRSTSSGSGFSNIATGVTATSYSNTGLSTGTRYYYRVQAVDDNGGGSYSSEVNRFTAPGQVTGLSASAQSNTRIDLSWSQPVASGYKIELATSSGGSYIQIGTTSAGTTTFSATGLTQNTTYYFRVRAFTNPGADGAYSSVVNETTQNNTSNPTNVSIATTSSGNYNNAIEIENIAIGSSGQNPVTDEDGSNFSSNAVTVDLNYNPNYEAALNNNNGRLELKCFGYIRATGATSFQWDISNLSVNQDTYSAINSVSTVGSASTSQDATSSGVGEVVRIQHNSGGRGYLMLSNSGDNISFDVDADATNSGGTTSASTLTVTLETV